MLVSPTTFVACRPFEIHFQTVTPFILPCPLKAKYVQVKVHLFPQIGVFLLPLRPPSGNHPSSSSTSKNTSLLFIPFASSFPPPSESLPSSPITQRFPDSHPTVILSIVNGIRHQCHISIFGIVCYLLSPHNLLSFWVSPFPGPQTFRIIKIIPLLLGCLISHGNGTNIKGGCNFFCSHRHSELKLKFIYCHICDASFDLQVYHIVIVSCCAFLLQFFGPPTFLLNLI